MPPATIHVDPIRWAPGSCVGRGRPHRSRDHLTATDAERAALETARRLDCADVLFHDRYRRVREIGPRLSRERLG